MLKLDTQGYDLKVFEGSKQLISRIKIIVVEISFQPIYENMPDYKTALGIFENSGFKISGLYPVSRNKDQSIIEVDCVLIKS